MKRAWNWYCGDQGRIVSRCALIAIWAVLGDHAFSRGDWLLGVAIVGFLVCETWILAREYKSRRA